MERRDGGNGDGDGEVAEIQTGRRERQKAEWKVEERERGWMQRQGRNERGKWRGIWLGGLGRRLEVEYGLRGGRDAGTEAVIQRDRLDKEADTEAEEEGDEMGGRHTGVSGDGLAVLL